MTNLFLKHIDYFHGYIFFTVIINSILYGLINSYLNSKKVGIRNLYSKSINFVKGAITGFVAGVSWYIGLILICSEIPIFRTIGVVIFTAKGINIALTVISSLRNFKNTLSMFMGKAYIDENRDLYSSISQGVSRYTWEGLQTQIGYNYSQIRNILGKIDRVDYFGGVTFCTGENQLKQSGVSIGNYINLNIAGSIDCDFDDRIHQDPLFMHEYGHTFDSLNYGFFYLFIVGIPSLLSAYNSTQIPGEPHGAKTHNFRSYEMRANRHAIRYFDKYFKNNRRTGILLRSFNTFYPTEKR